MQFSTLTTITTLLAFTSATPVPTWKFPSFGGFNGFPSLIPKNMAAWRENQCDMSRAEMPTCSPPLQSPDAASHLVLVAIGHGTQNYTCADSTANSIPAAAGAVANLYNASCIASSMPKMLSLVTAASQNADEKQLSVMPIIGHHYFSDGTTPVFDVTGLGKTSLKKMGSSPAPKNDNGNVPWLYLAMKPEGTNSKVVSVYRVNTNGGSAPATCDGMAQKFEVKYSTEYWFYASS